MPTLRDPWGSARIEWSPHRQGRIVVSRELSSKLGKHLLFPYNIPLTVSFRRDHFAQALHGEGDLSVSLPFLLAARIMVALFTKATVYPLVAPTSSTYRKRELSIPIDEPPLPFRLKCPRWLFDQDHRDQFIRFFERSDAWADFVAYLGVTMFPLEVLRHLVAPPRGRMTTTWPLLDCLPAALFLARELVIKSVNTPHLQKRIRDVVMEDQACSRYLGALAADEAPPTYLQQATIVALVDRAFRGAWERYGVPSVMQSPPQDVFRRYLYGKRRAGLVRTWKAVPPQVQEMLTGDWTELLLGPPGQAAREFALLR